jgi:hypothetical protein
MKSEPDRLDLLVVLLPLALVAVLGVQAYHFFQSRAGRAEGAELARQVEELATTKVELGPPAKAATPAAAGTPKDTVQPAAVNGDVTSPEGGATPATDDGSTQPPDATAGGDPADSAPAFPSGGAAAAIPSAQPRPASDPPPPLAQGGMGGAPMTGAAAAPSATGARGAGGTVIGAAAATDSAAPPSTPGDEPPAKNSRTSNRPRGSGAPAPEDPAKSEPRTPASVTATPQSAEAVVGQVIPVEIRIANGTNVASVPFHLKFDPKVVKLNGSPRSERGEFLAQGGSDPQFLVATGPAGDEVIIGLSLLGARAGASGDGALCTIYFLAVAPGTSPLQFTHASVRGPDARMLPATFLPTAIKVNG